MRLSKNYFKVIQITDSHLFMSDKEMLGVNTNKNFSKVIDRVLSDDIKDADAIFLTGDLSQDETPESYKILAEKMTHFDKPIFWIPGNHDSTNNMDIEFSRIANFHRVNKLSTNYWEFLFVDTKKIGTDKGYITDSELKSLTEKINTINNDKKIALVMHHHPIPVGTPIVDEYIIINSNEFWNALKNFKIDLIICGHVHGDYQIKHGNTDIHTGPATCLQWQKGATEIRMDNKIGYKNYYFRDGSYEYKTKIWADF